MCSRRIIPLSGGVLVATLALAACSSDKSAPQNPTETLQSFGRFTPGPTRAVLAGDHVILFGSEIALIDPVTFGREDGETVHGGLLALNPDTGATRSYSDPPSIYDLDWIERDQTFTAAAWTHIVTGAIASDGSISFKSKTIRKTGEDQDAIISTAKFVGDEIIAGTDRGFVAIDPDTLEVVRWIASGDLLWTRATARIRFAGDAMLALAGPEGSGEATTVLLIRESAESAETIDVPAELIPTAAGTLGERGLIGLRGADGRGEVRLLTETMDTSVVIDANALAAVSSEAFVPARFALDTVHNQLVIGGKIAIRGPVRTGGLAVAPVKLDGSLEGTAAPALDRRDPYTQLLPWEVATLEVDKAGRWYTSGWKLCSEHRASVSGLLRIEHAADGELRFARPYLSGVRTMVDGPDGATWVGLRDENPGLKCEGVAVQQMICRLKADGSCEIWTPRLNAGPDLISADPGAVAIAFGDAERHELAMATKRDATFVRMGETSRVLMTQIEPGVSLDMTGIAWAGPGALWVASSFRWDDYPDRTPEEEIMINARGPQGLGYLELGGKDASPTFMRRYVRVASDLPNLGHEEIGGLPSSDVRAVLPLGGRRALIGVARERRDRPYDHFGGELAPSDAPGAVVVIDDQTMTSIAPPLPLAAFGDVVAIAKAGDEIYVLDAEHGVASVDLALGKTEWVATSTWTAPERGLSLAADEDGTIAVGTTRGIYFARPQDEGGFAKLATPARTGFVWTVRFAADGVIDAGTDEGLVRYAFPGKSVPALGPNTALPRDPWPLDLGCNGEEGCACYSPDHCRADLDCACAGPSDCACTVQHGIGG